MLLIFSCFFLRYVTGKPCVSYAAFALTVKVCCAQFCFEFGGH